MGTVGRLVTAGLFVLFVGLLVGRPLLSTPAFGGLLSGETSGRELLLFLPLLVVAVVLVAARLRSGTHREGSTYQTEGGVDRRGLEDASESEQSDASPGEGSVHLTGVNPSGEQSVAIQAEPPDATLDEHLEHLRTELGDDRELSAELETLEEVAETVEADRRIPKRCPQDHCEALWTERTMFDVTNGQYVVLEEGNRVRCRECEAVVSVE